jgi:hypothetical protein
MSTSTSSGASLGKRAIAVLVMLVAAWILFKVLVHVAIAVMAVLAVVAAIFALIWAIRVL